jgi:hypothetical protein
MDAYFNFCHYTGWNRMGQFKGHTIISRYRYRLFNGHGINIAWKKTRGNEAGGAADTGFTQFTTMN